MSTDPKALALQPTELATATSLAPQRYERLVIQRVHINGRVIGWILPYFLIAIILQIASGAYKSEFSNPDSPAHHVTSIMVSQYLREGLSRSPMEFAEQYYLHYPKVAIGHWPPFYYLCAGIWGLLFGIGNTSYLVFMALLSGMLAGLLRVLVSHELGWWQGVAAGVLLLVLPPVREGSQLMMLDTMVALLTLLAGCALVFLFEKRKAVGAVLFGLLASCAILTKVSGIALGLVPVCMMVLMRNWGAIKRRVFWLSAVIVGVVAGPWTVYFMASAKNGLTDEMGWTYTRAAAKGFLWFIVDAIGPFLFVLAVYGIWLMVIRPFLRGGARGMWAMLFGLMVSTCTLHLVVPAGIDQRYLMTAFPSLVAFAIAGTVGVLDRLRERKWSGSAQTGVAIAVLALGIAAMRKSHALPPTEFGRVVEYVASHYSNYPKVAILVCSDAIGEGVVVSEFAALEPRPSHYFILRGSKQLAQSDWVGHGYHLLFNEQESLKKYLETVPITLILVDHTGDKDPLMKHVAQVESILANEKGMWKRDPGLSMGQANSPRKIELYAIEPENYRVPTQISVDMELMLRRKLTMQQ